MYIYISYHYIPTNSYKCIQKNSIKQWDMSTCSDCASTPAGTEVLRHRRYSPGPVGSINPMPPMLVVGPLEMG